MPVELDVGCGNHKHPGMIGVDLAESDADIVGSVYCLPFQSGVVDSVSLFSVMEHVEPNMAIQECRRVLKEEGGVRIKVGNTLDLYKILRTLFKGGYAVHCDHTHAFGEAELCQLLRLNGFQVTGISYTSFQHGERRRSRLVGLFPKFNYFIVAEAVKSGTPSQRREYWDKHWKEKE